MIILLSPFTNRPKEDIIVPKKRKLFIIFLSAVLLLSPAVTVLALNWEPIHVLRNSITLYINGTKLTGVSLFENEGTTYVPIRDVAEKLGFDVSYDKANQRGYITSKNNGTVSSVTTKANLMLSMLYKEAQLQLIAMVTPTAGASNTALTKAYMGDYDGAYVYFKEVNDGALANCIQILTDITDKYYEVLKKYSLQNTTAYKTKYDALRASLDEIKTKTKGFSEATLYFLKTGIKTNSSSAYNDYQNALADLTEMLTATATKFQNEANKLMSDVVGSDYSIMK